MIHLLFDTNRCEPVSTEKEWNRVAAWGQQVNAPELQKLLLTGRSDNLPALTEQAASARLKWAPDPETDRIVVKAIEILEDEDASAVIVTDGKEQDPPPEPIDYETKFKQYAEEMFAPAQSAVLNLAKQVQDLAIKTASAASPMLPNVNLALPEVTATLTLPPDSELYHKGTLEGVTKAIVDGLSKVQISTPVKADVKAPVVNLADARPLVVPELQTLVRMVESLAAMMTEMVKAIQELGKPKKPPAFTMEKQKDGSWKVRGN